MQDNITVAQVKALGYPVGNLWYVLVNDLRVARVAYHGNTLVLLEGDLLTTKKLIEAKIDDLYKELKIWVI